ncbi:MAG TPA: MmgE/PrpD family protein [Lapillicoccus sp.]|nr:MmgE/PrpD family protein [Lapillicoccus sp.]
MTSIATGSIGSAVSAFAAATRLDDIPAEVQRFGRLLFVDTLGALLGGLRYPPVQRLSASLAAAEVRGATSPFARLMTLGTAATWLDADSGGSFHPQGHRLPPVPTAHPAPHILPTLLVAAAERDLDDAFLLEVFLVAAEVGLRGGVASSLRIGLHPHGVHGPGSAALATALVCGLSPERLGDAYLLGSCLPLAATLDVPVRGGTVRNAWTGLGSAYGAVAADLVAAGARCDDLPYRRLFDGVVCTDLDDDLAIGELGRRWTILDSYLKPYACARWVHPALDATRLALAEARGGDDPPGMDPTEIERVDVETFAFAASLSATDVTSDMQARFSVPYSVAALIADGVLDAGSFLPDGLARRPVADLANRVHLSENPDMSAALPRERPATVTVQLRDGRRGTGRVRTARGNPDHPLTEAEVVTKFRGNVGDLLSATIVDDLVAALLAPDNTGATTHSVARLMAAVPLSGTIG